MQKSNDYKCTMVTFWMFAKLNALGHLITLGNALRGKVQIVWLCHTNAWHFSEHNGIATYLNTYVLICRNYSMIECRGYICKSFSLELNNPKNAISLCFDPFYWESLKVLWSRRHDHRQLIKNILKFLNIYFIWYLINKLAVTIIPFTPLHFSLSSLFLSTATHSQLNSE